LSNIYFAILLIAGLLIACATPAKFDFVKEGATAFDAESTISECRFQIALNKFSPSAQAQMLLLCMQAKGFRYRRVG
jgi:hypothetical protein